jgi:WD40 repeat protein
VDQPIHLWDLDTAERRADLIGHRERVTALAFTPDGKTLASGAWDRAVKLWSVAAGAEVASLEGHPDRVHCLAFSPDGSLLASGGDAPSGTGAVLLWRARP